MSTSATAAEKLLASFLDNPPIAIISVAAALVIAAIFLAASGSQSEAVAASSSGSQPKMSKAKAQKKANQAAKTKAAAQKQAEADARADALAQAQDSDDEDSPSTATKSRSKKKKTPAAEVAAAEGAWRASSCYSPPMEMTRVLCGLRTSSMNGLVVDIVSALDATTGRVEIRLPAGKAVGVKPVNLVPIDLELCSRAVADAKENDTFKLPALVAVGLCHLRIGNAVRAAVTALVAALALSGACHGRRDLATRAAMLLQEAVTRSDGDTTMRRFAITEARYFSSRGAPPPSLSPATPGIDVVRLLRAIGCCANASGLDRVSEILDSGVPAEACNPDDGMNALCLAAEMAGMVPGAEWGTSLMELLLMTGAPAGARSGGGRTPLMNAAHGGSAALCLMLLDAGARVDNADEEGFTALHTACVDLVPARHAAVVNLLLARGADVHAVTNDGQTALAYCAQRIGLGTFVRNSYYRYIASHCVQISTARSATI